MDPGQVVLTNIYALEIRVKDIDLIEEQPKTMILVETNVFHFKHFKCSKLDLKITRKNFVE